MDRRDPSLRAGGPDDHDALVALWRRAVEATHHFLGPGDVEHDESSLRDRHLDALALTVAELDGVPVGLTAPTSWSPRGTPRRRRRRRRAGADGARRPG